MKAKIGTKIISGFMLNVLILVFISVFAWVALSRIYANFNLLRGHTEEIEAVGNLQILLSQVVMPANDYIITADPKYRDEFKKMADEVEAQIKKLQSLEEMTKEESSVLKEVGENFAKLKKNAEQILAMEIKDTNPEAGRLMEEMDYVYAYPTVKTADKLLDFTKKHMESRIALANKIYHQLNTNMVVLVILGAMLAVFIGSVISRGISRPIIKLSKVAEIVATGDLTQVIEESKSGDEIASLNNSMKHMLESLRQFVQQLLSASMEITSSVSQIHTATGEQATGSALVSAAVAEVAATTQEFAATAGRIAEHAQGVTMVAGETLVGIQNISTVVEQTNQKMLSLAKSSQIIGNITTLINGIAAQTNLLALNAAIEAARAGEQGRGFAVVAGDVRKLASRSRESSKEIQGIITEIQTELGTVLMGVEKSLKWVDQGLGMMQETSKLSKEISLVTQQQEAASRQAVETVQNIAGITKEFSVSAKQTADSATQLARLAQGLKEAAEIFKI